MKRPTLRQLKIIMLVSVVLVGFSLRAYHFSDWLHFELDQARDARVVDDALVGGPGELTLLGPKAAGTFLRLAPGFYYLEYISGLIFGGSPSGLAMFVMLFSVLSLPVFFFFVRRYFSVLFSLGLTLLFATSAYFVMYGRFAWNPNILPFFVLLGFLALLRSVDEEETQRGRFFLGAVFLLTLATHAHFLAFLALPIIAGLFLLIKRPRFSWRVWVGAFVIVASLYLPMALNEAATGGLNTQEFFSAVTKKSTKSDHSLVEKFLRDSSEHVLGALLITTGFEGGTFPSITLQHGKVEIKCATKCDRGKWYGVTAAAVLIMSIAALGFLWWEEMERKRKDFLLLCGLWLLTTFALFLPLSYNFAPRFFLVSGMLFIILLGLFLVMVRRFLGGGRLGTAVALGVMMALVFSNLSFLFGRFGELSQAGTVAINSAPDRILKDRIRVTLEQQMRIVDLLEQRYQEHGYPVYMFSEPQHRRALTYLMELRGIENAVLGFDGIYRQGVYYLILRTQSDLEDGLKKYRENYTVGPMTSFGTLTVIELSPRPEAIIGERQDFSAVSHSDSTAPPRYTWKEFFHRTSTPSADQESGTLDQLEDTEQNQ